MYGISGSNIDTVASLVCVVTLSSVVLDVEAVDEAEEALRRTGVPREEKLLASTCGLRRWTGRRD
jgi:hypothetical protein